MNDWYPKQEAKHYSFLTNFVANTDQACTKLNVPVATFGVAEASATTWLGNYAACQAAEKTFDTSLAARQKQAPDTGNVRTAKQITGVMNVLDEALALLMSSEELGTVVLKYKKLGHQPVLIYGCRTGEEAFTLLGTHILNRIEGTRSNWVAGQPEQREYYAIYTDHDQPNCGPR